MTYPVTITLDIDDDRANRFASSGLLGSAAIRAWAVDVLTTAELNLQPLTLPDGRPVTAEITYTAVALAIRPGDIIHPDELDRAGLTVNLDAQLNPVPAIVAAKAEHAGTVTLVLNDGRPIALPSDRIIRLATPQAR